MGHHSPVRFCLQRQRRKKSKKSLSSDSAENLAESNKGLRPGAMAEGVERAAKRRMRPVGFYMTIYNFLKIWKAETLKQTNRYFVVFVKEALVPLGCSSGRTKPVRRTKLILHF